MEKTTQITIGSMRFDVTEAAYEKLNAYLQSLRAHFAREGDPEEIIGDIEARIAEKLLPKKDVVIGVEDIASVIADMGDAAAFDSEPTEASARKPKKLYRDTDNAIILGVASGIAAYFNVDPLWIRLAFVVSVFFGGTGIILYILIALIIPAAKTTSQRLEMRGDAVTLDTIARMVRERVEETKESGAITRSVRAIRSVLTILFAALGRLFGALIAAGSFFTILGLTAVIAVLVANWNTPYVSTEMRDVLSPAFLYAGIVAGYLALTIPLFFIFSFGARLVHRRIALPAGTGFALVGVWCLAVITTGALATRTVGDYYAYTESHPDYRTVSESISLESFGSISVHDMRVTLREGAEQSVVVTGRESAIERVDARIEDGVLFITSEAWDDPCVIFCRRATASVTITTPDIDELMLKGASASLDGISTDELIITAENSSVRGNVSGHTLSLILDSSYFRGDVDVRDIELDAKNSSIALEGGADTARIELRRSSYDGAAFRIGEAVLSAYQSSASVFADVSLTIDAEEQSYIRTSGDAAVER